MSQPWKPVIPVARKCSWKAGSSGHVGIPAEARNSSERVSGRVRSRGTDSRPSFQLRLTERTESLLGTIATTNRAFSAFTRRRISRRIALVSRQA
jgi:hypothetical protein